MATPNNYPICPKCKRALLYVDDETKTCPTDGHYTIRTEKPISWWKAMVAKWLVFVKGEGL